MLRGICGRGADAFRDLPRRRRGSERRIPLGGILLANTDSRRIETMLRGICGRGADAFRDLPRRRRGSERAIPLGGILLANKD